MVLLLTHPRTASNLVTRILNLEDQSGFMFNEYFFLPSFERRLDLAERGFENWTDEERNDLIGSLLVSLRGLSHHMIAAEGRRKRAFAKEHLMWMLRPEALHWARPGVGTIEVGPISNLTILPDSFLTKCVPTFLIRHPALVFPSIYRTCLDLEGPEKARRNADGIFRLEMTWRWSRHMWQSYNGQIIDETNSQGPSWDDKVSGSPWPIILDADDAFFIQTS